MLEDALKVGGDGVGGCTNVIRVALGQAWPDKVIQIL